MTCCERAPVGHAKDCPWVRSQEEAELDEIETPPARYDGSTVNGRYVHEHGAPLLGAESGEIVHHHATIQYDHTHWLPVEKPKVPEVKSEVKAMTCQCWVCGQVAPTKVYGEPGERQRLCDTCAIAYRLKSPKKKMDLATAIDKTLEARKGYSPDGYWANMAIGECGQCPGFTVCQCRIGDSGPNYTKDAKGIYHLRDCSHRAEIIPKAAPRIPRTNDLPPEPDWTEEANDLSLCSFGAFTTDQTRAMLSKAWTQTIAPAEVPKPRRRRHFPVSKLVSCIPSLVMIAAFVMAMLWSTVFTMDQWLLWPLLVISGLMVILQCAVEGVYGERWR